MRSLFPWNRNGVTGSEGTDRDGKVHYILLWLLGVPIPILLLIMAMRGCS